jgi:hypothetical protein
MPALFAIDAPRYVVHTSSKTSTATAFSPVMLDLLNLFVCAGISLALQVFFAISVVMST